MRGRPRRRAPRGPRGHAPRALQAGGPDGVPGRPQQAGERRGRHRPVPAVPQRLRPGVPGHLSSSRTTTGRARAALRSDWGRECIGEDTGIQSYPTEAEGGLNNLNKFSQIDWPRPTCFDTAPFRDQPYDKARSTSRSSRPAASYFMGCKNAAGRRIPPAPQAATRAPRAMRASRMRSTASRALARAGLLERAPRGRLAASAEQELPVYPGAVHTRIGNDLSSPASTTGWRTSPRTTRWSKVADYFAKHWRDAGLPHRGRGRPAATRRWSPPSTPARACSAAWCCAATWARRWASPRSRDSGSTLRRSPAAGLVKLEGTLFSQDITTAR